MPVPHYGVLKGRVLQRVVEADHDTPHYQVHLLAADRHFRVTVNVRSRSIPSELLYRVDDDLNHPLAARLEPLAGGFHRLPRTPQGGGLDYVRGGLVERDHMCPLPHAAPGPNNDLIDHLDNYVRRALEAPGAVLYAFGTRWGPLRRADPVFGFRPGNGMHNVHMNQGSPLPFAAQDASWQDGGLLVHYPGERRWVGIFLAFQSQRWEEGDALPRSDHP